jgi:HK97 family phage major capsid protein
MEHLIMSIQALREQRAAKAKSLHELANKADWNASTDSASCDTLQAEVQDLDDRIKRINVSNAMIAETALHEGVIAAAERIGHDQRSDATSLYAKWLRAGTEGLNAEDRAKIVNTMSVGTPSQGGYTVQTEIAQSVLDALKNFGGMRSVANLIQTAMGNPMNFPTSDGRSEVGEIVAENTAATAADITFGTIGLPVYKFSSKIVTVPWELLQDSNVDVESFVRARLVTRLGRITNTKFTVGTGSSEPNGVVTAATTGVTGATGNTVNVTYDALTDLQHSIDPAYRQLGNTSWMVNDDTIRILRKIKDAQSRPLFIPGYEDSLPVNGVIGGAPDSLMGRPIVINQDMPVMAANAKSILYGDLSFYTIRDVMQVEMFRFTDSAYASKGQVGFLAWMRTGGNLVDVGGAVKLYVNSAT